ncbi:hypothetical protein [Alloyangia pacifica]|uniref:hypothetical protein n=1 Tax=Alloyangia pacifica TaxID=311180 RepID=UPI001CFD4CCB|nr:hypothetical protein [Alloyangia pacifica]
MAISGLCALLAAATYFLELQASTAGRQTFPRVVQQFHLGHENNLAAWFSGALLALIALHALDGHTLYRSDRPKLARAWVQIGAVLLFLSADEIGSIHERLAGVGEAIGIGSWGLLLPLGGIIFVVLISAMALLWREGPTHRKKVGGLLVGFALLGSVAVQEFLEHTVTWDSAQALAARITIEEGTELFGMLILLGTTVTNSIELRKVYDRGDPVFAVLLERRLSVFVALIVLAPVVTMLALALEDHHRGCLADWLAAIAFLFVAAIVVGAWLQNMVGHGGLVQAVLLLVLSYTCVSVAPIGVLETAIITTTRRGVLIVVLSVAVLMINHRSGSGKGTLLRTALIAGVCLALLMHSESLGFALFLTILLGAVIYHEISFSWSTRLVLKREDHLLENSG